MQRNLASYTNCQVFLNHPYDTAFSELADAMAFAVVAGGLLPISALDLTSPDRPRLEIIVEAITHCHYSAHDFSRFAGGGERNFARMNMPLEMGMALFQALLTRRQEHRCAFFVSTPHDYVVFASDLAGLDPRCHNSEAVRMLIEMYEWLRSVVPRPLFNLRPTVEIVAKYEEFSDKLGVIDGSGSDGRASHEEARELMYQLCADSGWWDWRETRLGREEFPPIPLSFR
jgi:hypothetical protein